ncbi:MAG TPA: NCS2 family permease [Propioniciclava sp.]|jgi:AGZA family xanthine/uracil permease-like MFS transporter|uniref:NCS2 family permease n=1 Tax=Propioniciclava sp. TaxID=2038686 RepID=UPI002B9C9D6E|nr:NCS2 family permease [Propioniciclava sp.]HRL50615.1 NCS2 family permease [Propioniciclava sp.]
MSSSTSAPVGAPQTGLDGWFGITKRGSSVGQEVRGGLVTFFTMAYIIALNPLIIGTTPDKAGNLISGLPATDANIPITIAMVAAATSLVAGVMTIVMGVVGRFPLGLATGLGLNAMLAYVIAPQVTWPQAMGLVVWEGIIILILVLTGFREAVFRAVPRPLRTGIAVGIGLFITLVGLADAGIVRTGDGTPLQLGIGGSLLGWPMAIFVIGLFLLVMLYIRRVRGAMLIAIVGMTVVALIVEAVLHIPAKSDDFPAGWALNVPEVGAGGLFSLPDLSLLGRVDMLGAFSGSATATIAMVMTVFALLLADFFDTMGTIVAVGAEGDLLGPDGNPERTREIFVVDSLAAIAGGLGSVSSNTSYIESAAGVGEGARTGLASVVTGLAFLVSLFLAPLVKLVPSEAAAPALVFVGFLMLSQVIHVDWSDPEEGFPAFITMVAMPFTYSITTGIGAGFLFWVAIKTARGKLKDIHPLMWVIAAAFVIYFGQGAINALLA